MRELKQTAGTDTCDAFIPLFFTAGDALQFDWSEEYVLLGGAEQKIRVAHFRLCHSRKPFVVAYMNESEPLASYCQIWCFGIVMRRPDLELMA